MEKIVFINGKRTPFGAFGGSLKDVSATDLMYAAAKATLEGVNFKPQDIDHVVIGNVVQNGGGASYMPRHVSMKLGIPVHVGALGVNRLCGSGFQTWITAAQMILTGEAKAVLCGGVEQMSQYPYIANGARFGFRMGHMELEDALTTSLADSMVGTPMAITAENLATEYKLTREEVDRIAIRSQERCAKATAQNYFAEEIIPVVFNKKGETLSKDEHPKPQATYEKISTMKPLFKKDGVVTAANASGIVDGAGASILMKEADALKAGFKPLARILGWASVGCDPKIMGIGPVYAIRKALENVGMKLNQMDVVEVNEAFASQYLAVEKALGLNPEITNPNGSAIAVGHPLGASGIRIMNHLVLELRRRGARYGVGSACIGGGQGIAIVIENCM